LPILILTLVVITKERSYEHEIVSKKFAKSRIHVHGTCTLYC